MERKKNYRRCLAVFLAFVLAAAVLPVMQGGSQAAYAKTKYLTSQDSAYEYKVLGDGTVQIHRYLGTAKRVQIPAQIDGRNVTRIGGSVFAEAKKDVTSVTIPKTVTKIASSAFLTKKDTLTRIRVLAGNTAYVSSADGLLFSADGKTLLAYPAGKTDETYEAPAEVTSIGARAFQNAASLTSVKLPDGVTSIGDRAFAGCTKMDIDDIPESLVTVGNAAFSGCAGLDSFTAHRALTSIGSGAFSGCTGLKTLRVAAGSPLAIGNQAFLGCTALKEVSLSDERDITVGNSAFCDCSALKNITVPDRVSSIGTQALGYASNAEGGAAPVSGFVVIGSQKGTANTYAKTNRIRFRNIFTNRMKYYDVIPDPVQITKVKRGVTTLTVRYTKAPQSGADYQIGLKLKAKGSKWTYTDMGTARRKQFTDLQSWKAYQIRVRSYRISKNDGKRYYSAWSQIFDTTSLPARGK